MWFVVCGLWSGLWSRSKKWDVYSVNMVGVDCCGVEAEGGKETIHTETRPCPGLLQCTCAQSLSGVSRRLFPVLTAEWAWEGKKKNQCRRGLKKSTLMFPRQAQHSSFLLLHFLFFAFFCPFPTPAFKF